MQGVVPQPGLAQQVQQNGAGEVIIIDSEEEEEEEEEQPKKKRGRPPKVGSKGGWGAGKRPGRAGAVTCLQQER